MVIVEHVTRLSDRRSQTSVDEQAFEKADEAAIDEDGFEVDEVFESRLSISVVRDDSGPVVSTAVAGGPLSEPFELASCVPSVVPAATTALPLILQMALERTR